MSDLIKRYSYLIIAIFPFVFFAQEKFSKEIVLLTENDLYVSTSRDRYYTNGFFLNYRYLTNKKPEKLEKRILEWQIGHEMYNPNKSTVQSISEHDRPFAAYLFGSFGISNVYKKKKILNISLQMGTIGPDAFGEEVQDFVHSLYGFKDVTGWKYQIANAFGINLKAEYLHFITKSKTDGFDLTWLNEGRLGTVYSDISSGVMARFGFNPLASFLNSISFGTHLNNSETNFVRQIESFFFIKPVFRYAFYDATLQGSFLNDNSIITKELVPFVFDIAIGIQFTAKRLNFGYVFNYNTSKSKNLRYTYGNKYGSIFVSYLIR